jgi:hypothetical protein
MMIRLTITSQKSLFPYTKNKSKWTKNQKNELKYYLNCIWYSKSLWFSQGRNIFEKKQQIKLLDYQD